MADTIKIRVTPIVNKINVRVKEGGIKGDDGITPIKGVDYFDGADGYTPIKGTDYFDGTNGTNGTNGITPVKGVDYFDGINGTDGVDGVTQDISGKVDKVLNKSLVLDTEIAKIHDPLTISVTPNGLSLTGQELALQLATATLTGALSTTDWNTFNNKAPINSPSFTTQITTPLIVGGTAVGSNIIYKSTTGIGTPTGIAHQWVGGTNGTTVLATMLNNGNVGIGSISQLLIDNSGAIISQSKASFSGISAIKNVVAPLDTVYSKTIYTNNFRGYSSNTFSFGDGINVFTFDFLNKNIKFTNGNIGIGDIIATAALHLKSGTASANTAPLKLTSGTLMTTPEVGAIEFLTDAYYATITTGTARKQLAFTGLSGTKIYYVADTSGGATTRKLTFSEGILTSET